MPQRKNLHLICNAHLDPTWLWEWEEGAAEVMSTFRTAAELCEEYDGFVFNHNEAVLYEWVREYEPGLFTRIQKLVEQDKWHIMGGWFLQPDCNMPAGESFVRQILYGRNYFTRHFNRQPTTAINFDSFGHSRGLVQILAKSGFDSYLFCRPNNGMVTDLKLPAHRFRWIGFDGSEVLGLRANSWYNSARGRARQKTEGFLANTCESPTDFMLWGVGNHGGGPSRKDLQNLAELIAVPPEGAAVCHSTPEAYTKELKASGRKLPLHKDDLNQWAMGCYTTQVRIKQKHRLLENELYSTEKICIHASSVGLMPYPAEEVTQAERDLLFAEFHDILPGSSIQRVEQAAIRLMDHGLEILARLKARAFFRLASGQPVAREGRIPILAYNPHPYPVTTDIECEFQLADQNWKDEFTNVTVTHKGSDLPTQVEKEVSNLRLDWRKRVLFRATLAPGQISRFDCRMNVLSAKPKPCLKKTGGAYLFKSKDLDVSINTRTGLIDRYRVAGRDYLRAGAAQAVVCVDNDDAWNMQVTRYGKREGVFKLMPRTEGTAFSGVTRGTLPSVRVIEDGPVRTVVEAVLWYKDSRICQHYLLPKQGTEIGIETRVHWNEKSKVLRLAFPTSLHPTRYLGQVAYGVQRLPSDGTEAVAQKWVAVVDEERGAAITCSNDGLYGSSLERGILSMTLLRSPAFSGHPIRGDILPQDRYTARTDQGEFAFRFWLNAGPVAERLSRIDREALARNEKPFVLSFFPTGQGDLPEAGPRLSDKSIQIAACKASTDGRAMIVRLFEPTGKCRTTTLTVPALGLAWKVLLTGFEIKTLRIDLTTRDVRETNLLECVTVDENDFQLCTISDNAFSPT